MFRAGQITAGGYVLFSGRFLIWLGKNHPAAALLLSDVIVTVLLWALSVVAVGVVMLSGGGRIWRRIVARHAEPLANVMLAGGLLVCGLVGMELLYRRQAISPGPAVATPRDGLARATGYPSAATYMEEVRRYSDKMQVLPGSDLHYRHPPHMDEVFQRVRVRTNRDGWRNRVIDPDKRGRYRILLLGDSVVFGWGVAEDDIFARRLEIELNEAPPARRRYETINLGVGSYNTTQEKAALEQFGLMYEPDMVVLVYTPNDIWSKNGRDELDARNEVQPPRAIDRSLPERLRQLLVMMWRETVASSHALTKLQVSLATRSYADRRQEVLAKYGSVERYFEIHSGFHESMESLRATAGICAERRIPFLVYYFMFGTDFYREELMPRIAALGREVGFRVIDATAEMRLEGPVEDYANSQADGHPNARGHDLFAQLIAREIRPILEAEVPETGQPRAHRTGSGPPSALAPPARR